MLKSILKLNGAQELKKNEQKSMNGGKAPAGGCDPGTYWHPIERCCWSASHGHCHY